VTCVGKVRHQLRERLRNLRHIPGIVAGVWRANGSLVVISLALRLALAGLPAVVLWVSKLLIDAVVGVQSSPDAPWAHLWKILGLEFTLILVTDALSRLATFTDTILSDKFSLKLNTQLLEHANQLDLETFENPNFQDRLERARTQISAHLEVLTGVAQLVQTVVGLAILCAAVALYAPWLVVLQLLALFPVALTETYFAAVIHRRYRARTALRRTMDYLLNLGTSTSSAKEVKAFGLGRHLISEYSGMGEECRIEVADLSKRRNLVGAVLAVLGSATYYAGYAYLVWTAGHGKISIGTLVFLGGSFQRTKWLMQEMFMTLSRTLDQAMYLGDVFEFFKMEPRIRNRPGSAVVGKRIKRGFEFRDVSFTYSGSTVPALSQVSFNLNPGETIALVGSNGAGKTTLTKLLARLYEPTEGAILLDGIDLRNYDIESLRRMISIVFQDFVRYEVSAGSNIGFGQIEFKNDPQRLNKAARAGLATSVIDRLPRGYEQLVGRRFDGGVDLSGGEWQKLALSRGCMREAALLILDEPSAALDARNEYALFQHFSRLTRGKMAVLISHRLPTVRMAHKILVMSSGKLIEQGTHDSLMAEGGEYATLFRLQAAAYQR
jgi:ATP-binding cassette subfamily B protein